MHNKIIKFRQAAEEGNLAKIDAILKGAARAEISHMLEGVGYGLYPFTKAIENGHTNVADRLLPLIIAKNDFKMLLKGFLVAAEVGNEILMEEILNAVSKGSKRILQEDQSGRKH